MQRDAYAALVKKKQKKKIPLRILQMSGDIFKEWIFDEVFIGYRNRRLVLVTHMAGTDPRFGPRLGQDILVPDFSKLQRIHQPHFLYKLIPMMCSNIESFALLQAVCNSPGSPFVIEDRWDTHGLTMRFAIVSAHRELVKSELLQCRQLSGAQMSNIRLGNFPITGVEFDGALVKRGRVASTHNTATDSSTSSTSSSSTMIPIEENSTTTPKAETGASSLSTRGKAGTTPTRQNGGTRTSSVSRANTSTTGGDSSSLSQSSSPLSRLQRVTTGARSVSPLSAVLQAGRVLKDPTSPAHTASLQTPAGAGLGSHSNSQKGSSPKEESHLNSDPSIVNTADASSVGFVSSAALCTRVDYLTEADLNKRIIMDHFFRSPTYWKLGSNSQLFQLVRETRERIQIMGVSNPIAQGRTDLLSRARENGIHIYEKVGDYLYAYSKP